MRDPAGLPDAGAGLGRGRGDRREPFCAPVLLAFAAAAQSRALFGAIFFFLCFFAGTSIYLLPLPLLGFVGRWSRARLVARFAVGLMGAYYLYSGLLLVIRGAQWSRA